MRTSKETSAVELILAGLVVILVVIGSAYVALKLCAKTPFERAEFITEGQQFFVPGSEFVEEDVLKVDGTTVYIGAGCLAIIAETTAERAEAIELALMNQSDVRPSSWDGWASVLDTFNITFEATILHARNEDAYLSRGIFRQGKNVLDLDMRPSDAIALALRTGTPIYINLTLLRENGENIC